MHEFELVMGLMVVVVGLAAVAQRVAVPYPILLVLGGLALGFVPGLPRVALEPDVVFLLFLPPILFSTAYLTSWRDFRANARPIGLLAVGLVVLTMLAVAAAARWAVPSLDWPAALVLGAIVSPPDALATTAILQRLGVPRRVVTVLEGESLVNDATALVALRFAVAAVVTGTFSPWDAVLRFVVVAVGGVVIGVVVGRLLVWVAPRLADPSVSITATLIAPTAAYLPAEELGVSGVLAAVAAGLTMGQLGANRSPAGFRLQGGAVWTFVVFVINGLVFVLIGLQLPFVLDGLAGRPPGEVARAVAAVCLATILIRVAWVFPATYLPWLLRRRGADGEPTPIPAWRSVTITGWAGLRGVVSLAAALALPPTTATGAPFPERDLILLLTFCVILATLVGQGLTLPWLIGRLGVGGDDGLAREETLARRESARGALARLDAIAAEPWVPADAAAALRRRYRHRLEHFPASLDLADRNEEHVDAHERLRADLLRAEREAVLALRDGGAIGDEALRRVEQDLDLAEEWRGG